MRIKHHISGLYKKILIPIWILAFFAIGLVIVYGINTWDTGYAVNKYGSGNVYGGNNWASCKRVINNCTTGTWIFVPTKYDPEWDGANGFLAKKPACVTIAPCTCKTTPECRGGDICKGYVAPVWTCNGTYTSPTLDWFLNTSELDQSISDEEWSFGCIEGIGYNPTLSTSSEITQYVASLYQSQGQPEYHSFSYISNGGYWPEPAFPTKPSYLPTSVWQKANITSIGWAWLYLDYCNRDSYGANPNTAADVRWEAKSSTYPCGSLSYSSCTTQVWCSWGWTPETIGQCWPCDPNVWSARSTCSATCGWWTQTRTNECGTVQSQNCNLQACQFANKLTSISISAERRCTWSFPGCPSGYTLVSNYCMNCGTNGACSLTSNTRYSFCKKLNYTSAIQWSTCLIDSPATFSHGNYGWPYSYSYQKWVLDVNGNCINVSTVSKGILNDPNHDRTVIYTTLP